MDQINVTIIIITGKAQNQVQQPQTMTNTKKEATERELCIVCIMYQNLPCGCTVKVYSIPSWSPQLMALTVKVYCVPRASPGQL